MDNCIRWSYLPLIFRRVLFCLLGLFFLGSPSDALAQENEVITVYGPRTLIRESGKPNTWTDSFSACDLLAGYFIHVRNGDDLGQNSVSSAGISINGILVVGPSDFNQNTGEISKEIPIDANIGLNNTINISIASAPGGTITVRVYGGYGVVAPFRLHSFDVSPQTITPDADGIDDVLVASPLFYLSKSAFEHCRQNALQIHWKLDIYQDQALRSAYNSPIVSFNYIIDIIEPLYYTAVLDSDGIIREYAEITDSRRETLMVNGQYYLIMSYELIHLQHIQRLAASLTEPILIFRDRPDGESLAAPFRMRQRLFACFGTRYSLLPAMSRRDKYRDLPKCFL